VNLVFVGRHDRQKGLDYLLEVFAEAGPPSAHLHVIGAPVLHRAGGATTRDIPGTTFHGWLPRNVVSGIVAAADALVMPSRWEGCPFAALEAMRLAKPVIASRRSPFPEIIQDGQTGMLFDLEDRSQLLRILRDLEKGTLARMGRLAHEEFQRSFRADRMNSELEALYTSLVREHPSRRADQTKRTFNVSANLPR
jgi:glycosyltransferase involved in cell wall biosynthesis